MSILTVAIVSATSLLMGLIASNKSAVTNIQAYYFAQEGIEAVRNIRDSNWLHNTDWLGENSVVVWGDDLSVGAERDLELRPNGWDVGADSGSVAFKELSLLAPWRISNDEGTIYKYEGNEPCFSSEFRSGGIDTGFKRKIFILPYGDYVLVKSFVSWEDGKKDLTLETVLTNWKAGVL
jgi:hypothetical protein